MMDVEPDTSTDCSSTLSHTGHEGNPRKKPRSGYTGFTEYQFSELTKRYKMNPYIQRMEKEWMSKNLGLSLRCIGHWFRERRKREQKKQDDTD